MVDPSRSPSMHRPHPLFAHLTSLSIVKAGNAMLEDARVISYVLAHGRQLKLLRLDQILASMDDAFTHRRLIGAPLEQLDLSITNITDATIDVLCRQPQLAATISSLTLLSCKQLTRQGSSSANRLHFFTI